MLKITELRIDNQLLNVFTDEKNPQFSIKASSDIKCDKAAAWQIIVECGNELLWDSGKRQEEMIHHIIYQGKPLSPLKKYSVLARIWNSAGEMAEKSGFFCTGFMGHEWSGDWVTHPDFSFKKKENPPAMVFKKTEELKKKVKEAYVYVTALGVYTLQVNGKKVGNDMLAPGYTSYKNQIQYQIYEITDLLVNAKQVNLQATAGGGWAIATFGPFGTGQHAGKKQALLLELHVTYEDDSKEIFKTDETWKVSVEGPIREASIYDGEYVDARIDDRNLKYRNSFVKCTKLNKAPTKHLTATYGELPKRIENRIPVSEHVGENGVIFDFGQNFSGVARMKIKGKCDQRILIRHAEVLIEGELFTQPLRTAKARVEYICRDGYQEYTPYYTFMGFRYVEVSGIDREHYEISADVLSSIDHETGEFTCSNADVTKLQENIKWGGLSNFVDIPSDCPQRDERLGWTGDIAVFASTACFNFDMTRFLRKWLKDMRSEQGKKGGIPFVIPNEMIIAIATAGWGDSCVMVPWALYMDTGNREILRENFSMIKKYLKRVEQMAHRFSFGDRRYLWDYGFSFGDWVIYNEPQREWMKKRPWVSTAYYANSCGIAAKIADILGDKKEKERFESLREKIIEAYRKYFTDGSGYIYKEFQTAYICPMYFDMVKGEEAEQYAKNLVRLIEEKDNHLATGFLGTPYLLFALSDYGYLEKAYEILLQDTCPSWLYEVKAGATTIWERFDALRPDGTVNLGEGNVKDISEQNINLGGGMVSFNHYANGAVGDWLYRRCAGIEAVSAGYEEFMIKPMPDEKFTWVNCEKECLYGKIVSNWKIEDGKFKLDVQIPFGTKAQIILPDGQVYYEGSGEYHYEALHY